MRQWHKPIEHNQKGEAMLVTTILLLVLVVIIAACSNIAGMQWNLSYLQRDTSNTYYLAQSGVEKGVDLVNKAVQAQMPVVAEELRNTYFVPITSLQTIRTTTNSNYYGDEGLYYDNTSNGRFYMDRKKLSEATKKSLYRFIESKYIGKTLTYSVKGDGQEEANPTEITVSFREDPSYVATHPTLLVVAEAVVKEDGKVKDKKTVQGVVELAIPDELNNTVSEAYNWLYNPPELLDSALTCFSDVVITSGASLEVGGDMRIKGTLAKTTTASVGSEVKLVVPTVTSIGGLVVSNGGRLMVTTAGNLSGVINEIRPADAYLSGGSEVVMTNRRNLLASASVVSQLPSTSNYSSNTGSIYCVGNVLTTQGWAPDTYGTDTEITLYQATTPSILVGGDVIANTVAIADDADGGLNKNPHNDAKKTNNSLIEVQKNVFVDNDVRITAYVTDSNIKVHGAIFGISDGSSSYPVKINKGVGIVDLVDLVAKDPNLSSGVFNQGGGSSLIEAEGMYVNGQPFIDFGGSNYYALWESIGEPFKDVRYSYDLTNVKISGSNLYLNGTLESEVKRDKIWIKAPDKNYVPNDEVDNTYSAKISAVFGEPYDPINGITTDSSMSVIHDKEEALALFYKEDFWDASAKAPTMSNLTSQYYGYNKSIYFRSGVNYYSGDVRLYDENEPQTDMYFKQYYKVNSEDNLGLRGYMLSKRSPFYGGNSDLEEADSPKAIKELDYDGAVGPLSGTREWSYDTPIHFVDGGVVDISEYYVDGETEPYPTILVNTNKYKTLTLKANDPSKQEFKGLIISKGNVEIFSDLTIEGSLIIGGNPQSDAQQRMLGQGVGLCIGDSGTEVKLIHNPDVLLQIKAHDKVPYRQVLDALKITRFNEVNSFGGENTRASKILGPYIKTSDDVIYRASRVKLSAQSVLELETNKIKVRVKNMKKLSG